MQSWYLPAFLAFFFWGLWALFPKITTSLIDPRSALFFQALGAFSVALVVLATLNFRPQLDARAVPLALLTGVLGMTGGIAYLYAISRGPAMLVSVLTALYPLLTVVLAWLFMGESVSVRQWLGIALALVAMALLAG
ncbi:MAG: EamA family transporter [Pseudomonadota bacterium]